MTQFRADTSAVTAWGQQVSNLSDEVKSFVSGAPGTSGVQNSHGTIGFPMQDVLDAAQSARGEALGATQSASAKIGDLLNQASQAYERGDSQAAARLKAQADRMESAQTEDSRGTGSPSAPGGQGGVAQTAGQMMGQFGQLAGQMMQGVTQPVQGVVQGLSQIPQQAMQGAQGIVQTAMQGAGGGGAAAADAAAKASAAGAGPGAPGAGEKAPVQRGIMSEDRMRELQGLPPVDHDVMVGGGDRTVHHEPGPPRLPPIYGDWPDTSGTLEPGPSLPPPVSRNWPNDDMPDSGSWESPPFLPDKS
jgi:hypothetical protein